MKIGCVSLVPLPGGKFVAIRCTRGRGVILPGGKMEGEETFLEAAARELREETGLEAVSQVHLYSGPIADNSDIIAMTFLTQVQNLAWVDSTEGEVVAASWEELCESVYRSYYEVLRGVYQDRFQEVFSPPNILAVIQTIRDSFVGSEHVYTNGSCFQFARILAAIFPEGEIMETLSHCYFQYRGKLYDIAGERAVPDGLRKAEQPSRHGKFDALWGLRQLSETRRNSDTPLDVLQPADWIARGAALEDYGWGVTKQWTIKTILGDITGILSETADGTPDWDRGVTHCLLGSATLHTVQQLDAILSVPGIRDLE